MANEGNPPTGGAMSDALKDEITQMMGGVVNNMLTARLKTFEKQLHDKIGLSIGETLTKTLDEKLKDFKPAPSDDEGKDGKKGKSGGENVELATLRKQLADMNSKVEMSERRANEERAKNRGAALEKYVATALSPHGIEGARFRGAYAMLQQYGLVKYRDDDNDDLVFVDPVTREEVDLSIGLKGWIKSEDAKLFMPPTGARGSGSRPGAAPNGTGPVSREGAQANAMNYLAAAIKGEFGRVEQDEG